MNGAELQTSAWRSNQIGRIFVLGQVRGGRASGFVSLLGQQMWLDKRILHGLAGFERLWTA